MQKKKKIFLFILLSLFFILIFSGIDVYAIDDPISNANDWKPNIVEETILFEKAGILLGTINVIGVVGSVIVLIIIGIKYMFGSIEEKAEYKKTIWTYILGMFLVISATTIPNLIFQIMDGFF